LQIQTMVEAEECFDVSQHTPGGKKIMSEVMFFDRNVQRAQNFFERPYLLRRSRISEGGFSPRYSILTSIVNCPGPAGFAVQVYGLPASAARLPVASISAPFPEAVKPVTLPSVIVSADVPSLF
jgi:hypothetical protein